MRTFVFMLIAAVIMVVVISCSFLTMDTNRYDFELIFKVMYNTPKEITFNFRGELKSRYELIKEGEINILNVYNSENILLHFTSEQPIEIISFRKL